MLMFSFIFHYRNGYENKKKGTTRRTDGGLLSNYGKERKVEFNGSKSKSHKNGILKPSPSTNTLNRIERDGIVLWRRPFTTTYYAIMEIFHLLIEFLTSLLNHKLVLFTLSLISAGFYYAYITPGDHQQHIAYVEKTLTWWGWWVFLGVLSSIGLGSGLHTFLIYLGPHIAAVTLAAYECDSLNFPEPPYPERLKIITIWIYNAYVGCVNADCFGF
uniref:Uncharacterized protein n=1 Tax=Heterorhabditis bacteriophora TaxID=37862 RepID=A0A1I7W9N7_HETBA